MEISEADFPSNITVRNMKMCWAALNQDKKQFTAMHSHHQVCVLSLLFWSLVRFSLMPHSAFTIAFPSSAGGDLLLCILGAPFGYGYVELLIRFEHFLINIHVGIFFFSYDKLM